MNVQELQDKITELESQIEIWNKFNKNNECSEKIFNTKVEIEKLKERLNIQLEEILTKESNGEYDIIIPTHNDITKGLLSGEFSFLTKLLSVSNFTDIEQRNGVDMEAYIYEKFLKSKIEELKSQGVKVPSKNTLKKYMKTFENITIDGDNFHLMNVINTPNGIVYQFKQSYNGKYFITIPSPMLRELILGVNEKTIKLYCVIARKLQMNNEYKKFTREYLCNGMGINPIEANLNYISTLLNILRKLGHIKIKYEWIKVKTDEGYEMQQQIYIRLATYQEWKNKE